MGDWMEFLERERASLDTIDVKRVYIDMAGGLVAGVMLSQIVFWHLPTKKGEKKLTIEKDGRWWMAKTRKEWWDECRVTPRQVDRSIIALEERGLITKKVMQFQGKPTLHIAINKDRFLEAWNSTVRTNSHVGENGFTPKSNGSPLTVNPSIAEITAKTTPETTKKKRAPKAPLSIPDDLVEALTDFNQTAGTEFVPDKGLVSLWSIAKQNWEMDYLRHAFHNYALSKWHHKKFRAGQNAWNLKKFLRNRDDEIKKRHDENPPAAEGTGYQPIDLSSSPEMSKEELDEVMGHGGNP